MKQTVKVLLEATLRKTINAVFCEGHWYHSMAGITVRAKGTRAGISTGALPEVIAGMEDPGAMIAVSVFPSCVGNDLVDRQAVEVSEGRIRMFGLTGPGPWRHIDMQKIMAAAAKPGRHPDETMHYRGES